MSKARLGDQVLENEKLRIRFGGGYAPYEFLEAMDHLNRKRGTGGQTTDRPQNSSDADPDSMPPAIGSARTAPDITPLTDVMARLRHPEHGCSWDVQQNFASIAPYTIEEAYEVVDAIARDDLTALRDELGDLLLQVVFHSRMAEEQGAFTLSDVIAGITAKMVRRHPHVFGDGAPTPGWESIKAEERKEAGAGGALDGVAVALPALMRALKLQTRAARTGFDWPDTVGVREKILEEIEELDAAISADEIEDEAGDLLFALVNLVRHKGVDPEVALRRANAKFERRFRMMEALANGTGAKNAGETAFALLTLEEKEALWVEAKRRGL
jgi:ATP diphosphatase